MTIKQKQCLLAYLGYYTGEIDGLWGPKSQEATEAFQRAYGLTVDGIFGVGTEQHIREVIASGEEPTVDKDTENGVVVDKDSQATGTFWDDIQYFKRAEFRCTCGRCGGFPVEPQEDMVRTVNEIRRVLGIPISIVDAGGSGVRCPTHNAEVGGVWNSEHLYGRAADLHSSATPAQMKAAAEKVMGNTGGIGLYSWGIHVDTGKYSRWNG